MATNDSTLDKLFELGAHFGYSRARRHPSMKDHIFGLKNKVEIIDLEKTEAQLEEAKKYLKSLGERRAVVLWIGGKNEARQVVQDAAEGLGQPFVTARWIGGTLTNFSEIRKRMQRLEDLAEKRSKGEFEARLTKRERLMIDREIAELQSTFSGLSSLREMPHAMVVVDPRHEANTIREAKQLHIPVVALMNSDCNLGDASYPIVANDASRASILYFVTELANAYKEGQHSVPQTEKSQQ